jgi:TolB-like protein
MNEQPGLASHDGGEPDQEAIRLQLARILASPLFANAPSQERMLRYVVEHALAGEAGRLKEYTLGVEVFDRGADFDPRQDTIVRVQGRRLRDRLADYYRGQGVDDPVVISLPKGHYVPTYQWRHVRPPMSPDKSDGRKRVFAIIGLLVLIIGGWVWSRFGPARPEGEGTRPNASIAVLPFVDMSADKDQEYLADGLAEEITNLLAGVRELKVTGRTSSFSFKGTHAPISEIGRTLGVAHVLEGSVRKSGDRLRVTAQLIKTDDGFHLWTKTYDTKLENIFAIQDQVARDVVQALSVKLDAVMLNRAQGGTTNVDAYDRFLRWRQLFLSDDFDAEHDRQRILLAREAVTFDPNFVLGLDALATSLRGLADDVDAAQAAQLRAEADQIYKRIAEMAPASWIAKRERAYHLWREGKRADAIAVAKEIMDGGPLTYEHWFPYINLIFAVGHLEETVALVERLRTIEPKMMFLSRDLQYDYIAARRFPESETEYRRSLALEGNPIGPAEVAFARMLAGKDSDPKALGDLHRQLLQSYEKVYNLPFFRDLGHVLRDRDAMLAILRRAANDPVYAGGSVSVLLQADLADALGDDDLAAAALRKFLESREGFRNGRLDYMDYFPLWIAPYSRLRSHPEFKKLLVEMGVVDYWRQTGKWGDGCKPVGADDFECQ